MPPPTVKNKILFINPGLIDQPSGGGNVIAWMLEGLKKEYEITIVTWQPFIFSEINEYYGTSLCDEEFNIVVLPYIIRLLTDLIPYDPWKFQRFCLSMRLCKIIGHRYDILLSSSNEIDFGTRGIQYIHYPYLEEIWQNEPKGIRLQGFAKYVKKWITSRIRPWRILSGFSFERMKENLSLVNSEWTARVYKKLYDSDCITVYPPVPGNFHNTPWTQRETGFVCVGRLSGEKKFEDIISILKIVRKDFPELHLHIIGSSVEHDQQYYQKLKKKIKENSEWIYLTENLPRRDLIKMICMHKYGIHARHDEHFGISVAEMVLGGCIVFVPDDGGQMEIVGHDKRLLFHTQTDAADRILNVINNSLEQKSLLQHLASRKSTFSSEKFMSQMQKIVRDFIEGKI
jgi:glycosyltransferase involved in cell wall biosynthesis